MVRDVVPQLGELLDGISVANPALTFAYVEYGRHFAGANYPKDQGLLTVRQVGHPRRRSNMGGGALRGNQVVEIVAMFEDDDDIANLDAYKRLVKEAIEAVIRDNEHAFDDSFHVAVVNGADASGLLSDAGVLRNEVVVTVEAKTVEVW